MGLYVFETVIFRGIGRFSQIILHTFKFYICITLQTTVIYQNSYLNITILNKLGLCHGNEKKKNDTLVLHDTHARRIIYDTFICYIQYFHLRILFFYQNTTNACSLAHK